MGGGYALHRFDPSSGMDTSIGLPRLIDCFALREHGGFVDATGGRVPITMPVKERQARKQSKIEK
jgi:hypothetical protein